MDACHSITYHITKTGNMLRQLTAKRMRDAGIDVTPEEAVILNQLWDRDNQTITELGAWSIKEPSTLTRQIDALQKKGYVSRHQEAEDRRKVFVRLTRQGKKLQDAFNKTNIPKLDADMATVSKQEIEQCLNVLLRIRENVLAELQEK